MFVPTVTISLEEYKRLQKNEELNKEASLAKHGAEIMKEFLKELGEGIMSNSDFDRHLSKMSKYVIYLGV